MALTPQSRKRFIDSAVAFLERHRLDGLDVDWEYPGQPGAGNKFRPEDKQNYTLMLKELRTRFNIEGKKQGKHWYTSIATGATPRSGRPAATILVSAFVRCRWGRLWWRV